MQHNFTDQQVSQSMAKGGLDLLCLVTCDEIKQTIELLISKLQVDGDDIEWTSFFRYFQETWMESYKFTTWNISDLDENQTRDLSRTNNCLENFN
jgi:hypothetical protein